MSREGAAAASNPNAKEAAGAAAEPQDPAEDLSQCILSQYKFCVAGIGGGAAYTIARKRGGLVPVMAAGVAGSMADIMWGLTVSCRGELEAYRKSRGLD